MPGYVVTWDGDSSSGLTGVTMQKVRRGLFGAVRDALLEIPGKDGAELFTERRGNRRILLSGTVVQPISARHDAVVMLGEWLDRNGYRTLTFDDQPDRYWMAMVKSEPDPDEWRQTGKFDIEWSALPYAFALATSSQCVTATDGADDDFTIPDTVDAYPVVEVTPLNGTILGGFSLDVNGDTLSYAGDVAQGQTITISSLNFTVTATSNLDIELTGVYIPGTTFPADVSGEFPILYEGVNTWAFTWDTGTATQVRICFTWRRRYR